MANKKLYVGNLPFTLTSADLEALFAPYGTVTSAQVVLDRATNQSRGFGFVELESAEAADKAVNEVNGKAVSGRTLTVNEARERPMGMGRGPGGGGGGGGGGYGRGPRGPGGPGGGYSSRGPRY
ncbi:MAG: RNA recognition motif domain-containing protein [Pseudomonadota bacterium]